MDNTLITQDRLDTFNKVADKLPKGTIAEVGVYKGGSLKYLAELFPDRRVVGFDTFTGLPKEQWSETEHHTPGEFGGVTMDEVLLFIDRTNVTLVEGLFPEAADSYEKDKFALVHIDTDFYLSIKACLEWFWPRMAKGGVIVIDDYEWPNCPGVKQAIDEFGKHVEKYADYQAVIVKTILRP